MIFATSDIHGYPLDSFLGLLEKAGFSDSDQLYVIGDVIDRNGDGGVAMLRWMMKQENVTLLKGNHEQMMLECEFALSTDVDLTNPRLVTFAQEFYLLRWHRNGCLKTLESLLKLRDEDPDELGKLVEYVKSAPLYMEVAVPMKRFVLVHGGLNGFEPGKGLDEYDEDDLLWHTPTQYIGGEKGKMFVTDTWADIDTGAAGGGSPMLLRLDDMCPFYAE